MAPEDFENIWEYYIVLEEDMSNTARYVEPSIEQENVYSFEFYKLLILACCEFETVAKLICKEVAPEKRPNNIEQYKKIILHKFPMIVTAFVCISRSGQKILPFSNWIDPSPFWWNEHNDVKHNRSREIKKACYRNTIYALAGLYISILYLGALNSFDLHKRKSKCLTSKYAGNALYPNDDIMLPDFST
jgi:hypothetical protein